MVSSKAMSNAIVVEQQAVVETVAATRLRANSEATPCAMTRTKIAAATVNSPPRALCADPALANATPKRLAMDPALTVQKTRPSQMAMVVVTASDVPAANVHPAINSARP
jgi:hypothetical protein